MEAKGLPDNTFYPVASNRIPRLALDRYAQAAVRLLTCQIKKREAVASQPFTVAIDPVKLPGFPEKTGLGESIPLHGSGREPFTSSGAPSFNHCLSCSGTHPTAKSMGTLPFDVAGLKSSLAHGIIPLNFFMNLL